MLSCPLCSSTLSETVFNTGICPVCGGALHLDDQQRAAAADQWENRPVKLEYVEDASITDSVALVRATLSAIVRQSQKSPVSERSAPQVDFSAHVMGGDPSLARTSNFGLPPGEGEDDVRDTLRTGLFEEPYDQSKDASRITSIGQTIDVRNLSPEEKARVTAMWKGMATPPAVTPRMTVRTGDAAAKDLRRTTLVVKPRDVRKSEEPDSISADYELLNLIGEGGMGVVYAARQASIDRVVAVKMLNAEIAGDAEQRHKFLSEAVVTGELDHPNIVPIYDLGSNESGALFYSMKRVVGTPWLEVLTTYALPQNLEVLMKVADAVAFAHSRGVIHRDLKPENVMLGGFGEVLVMDWGLALSTGTFRKSGSITQSSSMGGTPAYMAPEMATGPVDRVTTASDIYLLGGMLYEVITGQPPHTGKNIMNCLYAAARNEIQPTKHSGELVDIAKRAMSTDQSRRYGSVQEFQAAVRAYQSHSESIVLSTRAEDDLTEAQRTNNYQTYARALFGFQEAVALWSGNVKASQRLIEAKLAYAKAATAKEDYDLAASLLDAQEPRHADLRKKIIAAQKERQARQNRLRMLRNVAAALIFTVLTVVSVAFVVVYRYWNEANVARNKALDAQASLVNANKDLDLKRAEAETNARIASDNEKIANTNRLAAETNFEKAQLATAAEAKQRSQREYEAYVAQIGLASAKIEENAAGQALELLQLCIPQRAESQDYRNWEWRRLLHLTSQPHLSVPVGDRVKSIAVAPNGEEILVGATSGSVRRITATGESLQAFEHGGPLNVVLFVGAERALTAGGAAKQGVVKLWDLSAEAPREMLKFTAHETPVLAAAISNDGSRLVTAGADGAVQLWSLALDSAQPTAEPLRRPMIGHSGAVWDIDFSPDQTHIVTAGQDRTAIIWSLDETKNDWPLPAFRGHTGAVYACAFSPDGRRVVSAGADRRVLIWDIDQIESIDLDQLAREQAPAAAPRYLELRGHTAEVRSVDFAPDGNQVLSASNDHTVKVWDAAKGTLVKTLRGHDGWVRSCRFADNGRQAVTGSFDNTVAVWPVAEYREQIVYSEDSAAAVLSSAASPHGKWIATAHQDGAVRLWDRATGKLEATLEEGHDFLGETAAYFPDRQRILTGARDSTVRIWNIASGAEQSRLTGTGSAAQDVVTALAPSGQWLCTGVSPAAEKGNQQQAARPFAQLWKLSETTPAAQVLSLEARADVSLSAAAFAPQGALLFTGRDDGPGQLWDLHQNQPLHELHGHVRRINAAHFTSDGASLITASDDHTVLEWDPVTGEKRSGRELFHPRPVRAMTITPNDRLAITACADNKVRVWDRATSQVVAELPHGAQSVSSVAISPDGARAATVSHREVSGLEAEYQIHLWDLHTFEELGKSDAAHGWLDHAPRRSSVWQANFSPDGDSLLAVGGRHARLFNLATRQQERSFGPQGAITHLAFAHDSDDRLVTAGADGTAKIWSVSEQRVVAKLEGVHTGRLASAAFAPNDSQILTAGEDGKLVLWDIATAQPSTRIDARRRVRSAEMSADGARIITASNDGAATIWNASTGAAEREFRDGNAPLNTASLSPDGALLIAGDANNIAHVWNAQTGELLQALSGHTAEITVVGFSPDSSRILTAASDNLVKIWDLTGKELLTLRGHAMEVTSAAFTAEGDRLDVLTASRDGTAILWPAADAETATGTTGAGSVGIRNELAATPSADHAER